MMKTKVLALAVATALAPMTFAQGTGQSVEEVTILGQEFTSVSESGSRLNLSLKEIPATLDVIEGDALRIRRDQSILDGVTRSAGFSAAANPGNGGTSICARGFCGQDAVTKLYDGNHYFTMAGTITFPFDTWGVERVEVLKGPASVLYGNGGITGAYNVIPKSAADQTNSLRLSAGEDGERFVGVSLSGEIESVKARVDYSANESDIWLNNSSAESEMLALAVEWQASEALKLTFRHDAGDQSPVRYFGIPVIGNNFNDDWLALNLSPSDTRINYDDSITRIIADWDLSESVTFNGEVYNLTTDRYWRTVESYFYDGDSGMIERWDPLIINHDMEQTGFRGNFVFDSTLGSMPWKTSIGFETTDISLNYISNFNPTHPDRVDWGGDFDSVDPDNYVPGSWYDISDSVAALDQVSDVSQYAFFAETQLKFTDWLALVAGVRYDNIDTDYERLTYDALGNRDTSVDNSLNQEIDPVMYRLGLVYDLNEDTAIYGQLSSGETHPRGGDVVRVTRGFREAETVTVEQYEVGIKQSLLDERLRWNLALFDITRQNMVIDDPDSSDPSDFSIVPEQTARGVELGIDFAPTDMLVTYANFALVDSERDTGSGTIPTPDSPDLTVNAGLLYTLSESVRFGADYRFVDERPDGNKAPMPSFSVVDLSLSYLVSENVRLTANAQNIFDEVYATADHWAGTQWLVGKPRTLSLTADLSF